MSTSTVQMVFGLALTMMPFVVVIVVALSTSLVFPYFFQKFLNFCVQIYGLVLGFRFRAVVVNLLHTECLNGNPKLTYVFESANMAFQPEWANYVFA